MPAGGTLVDSSARLRDACDALTFSGKVDTVYNPLRYAWEPHRRYVEKYGAHAPRRALLIGMNPGPWGMGQTGVPFGDVHYVRDWMGITGDVAQPGALHAKRPIQGFATTRKEMSGTRLYGWAQQRFGSAKAFFDTFFIVNYCPLLFFNEAGQNLTPPQLPKAETQALYDVCDEHMADVIRALSPTFVLGIGGFANARVQHVIDARGFDVTTGTLLHPSPASPAANRGWAEQAERQLADLGVIV